MITDQMVDAACEVMYEQADYTWNKTLMRETLEAALKVQPDVCPFDCDHCHDEDCPCDRLGCAGSGVRFQTP
jgi:hypothetical protein